MLSSTFPPKMLEGQPVDAREDRTKIYYDSRSADKAIVERLNSCGNWRMLSNFHEHRFHYMGLDYWTVEAAFHAAKPCMTADDKKTLASCRDPAQAKTLGGRSKKGLRVMTPEQQEEWGAMKHGVLETIVSTAIADDEPKNRVLADIGDLRAVILHGAPRIPCSRTHVMERIAARAAAQRAAESVQEFKDEEKARRATEIHKEDEAGHSDDEHLR